jgi:hypothetical protein
MRRAEPRQDDAMMWDNGPEFAVARAEFAVSPQITHPLSAAQLHEGPVCRKPARHGREIKQAEPRVRMGRKMRNIVLAGRQARLVP